MLDRVRSFAGIAVAALLIAGCSTEVLHNVPEIEANEIVSTLQNHGIEASKEVQDLESDTWMITVADRDSVRAWELLTEYKLPRRAEPRVVDIFGGDSLVRTPTQEDILAQSALEGEIAHTLQNLKGAIDARVHLVPTKTDLTGRTVGRAKASVVLEYQPVGGVSPLTDVEIQRLVAHSVEDLDEENVAVVQKPGGIGSSTAAPATADLTKIEPLGLTLEKDSAARLKLYFGVAALLITILGAALILQSRLVSRLRGDLAALRGGGGGSLAPTGDGG